MPSFSSNLTQSFRAAWRGLLTAFRSERTFRVMLAGGLGVVVLVSTLPFQPWQRILLLLLTGGILVLELLNSVMERLVDLLKPRLSPYVAEVKDLMAAAVLVAACFSALVAALILLPYVGVLLRQV